MDVLFEHNLEKQSSNYEGLTDNYIRVIAESLQDIKGEILPVKLKAIKEDYIEGELDS